MARWIDADKLMERFRIVAQSGGPVVVHVSDICAAIEDEVYEESVEVVRCKDCKHGCEDHEDAYLCNNAYYGLIGFTRGEDFCSYGERRNEE